MWYLTSEYDPRVLYIFHSKQVAIGRIEGDEKFSLHDDTSISRNHAILYVSDNNLFLKDVESRYGTFINDFDMPISPANPIKLNKNDVVRFGKLNSIWKVHFINFVTCTSTLKGDSLLAVKSSIDNIEGLLKSEWDSSCNFLTMPTITLTIKVVLALVQGSHIVSKEFWNKCVEAVNKKNILPDPKDYMPVMAESTLNKDKVSFEPDERRKKIFAGKKFVFFSRKQWEMYKTVLNNSSGEALLLSESKMTKSRLTDEDIVLIQYNITNNNHETQAQKNQINDIVNYLKSKGKRVIPDPEIGLAILYCSIEKCCNPSFNLLNEVIKKTDKKNEDETNVLACETQEMDVQQSTKHIVIDESLTSKSNCSLDTSHSTKRKHIDDEEMDARKKIALVHIIDNKVECGKRKFSDESNTPPVKRVATDNNVEENEDFLFESNGTTNDSAGKKLKFTKPFKNANHKSEEDENLFDFIEDKSVISNEKSNTIFDINQSEEDNKKKNKESLIKENKFDVTAMRGVKLKELMENNHTYLTDHKVKKEIDELNHKMDELDLGCVVLKVRNDLVIKKEDIDNNIQDNSLKNFKKFKKVWPIKTHSTISKTSVNFVVSD